MRVESTLRAGAPGTKRFMTTYGNRLVCVRTRRDGQRGVRYTTVELIVEERAAPVDPTILVGVRVRLDEPVLRHRVKAAGGRWLARHRVWVLERGAVEALGLEDRVAPRLTPADLTICR